MKLTIEHVLKLTGDELDEAVALGHGWVKESRHTPNDSWVLRDEGGAILELWGDYHPSTNGAQCMEIMEREKIDCTIIFCNEGKKWKAKNRLCEATGETAMIAICRCFVISKLEVINETNL